MTGPADDPLVLAVVTSLGVPIVLFAGAGLVAGLLRGLRAEPDPARAPGLVRQLLGRLAVTALLGALCLGLAARLGLVSRREPGDAAKPADPGAVPEVRLGLTGYGPRPDPTPSGRRR